MPIPAKVVVGSQDHDGQCKCRNLFSSVTGSFIAGVPTYQREANYYIIVTKAVSNLDTCIVSESHDIKNQDYEDDIDDGQCRSSSSWIYEIRLWPGCDDFLRWMHSVQLIGIHSRMQEW